jgi:hypothetical protein
MGKTKMEARNAKFRGRILGSAAQDQARRVAVASINDNILPARGYLGEAQSLERGFLSGQARREMQVGFPFVQAVRDFAIVKPAEEKALAISLKELAYAFRLDDVHTRADYHHLPPIERDAQSPPRKDAAAGIRIQGASP